ncbi:MAG: hypothetical protein R2705_12520 [Ilumatobacteraceae bacterium]
MFRTLIKRISGWWQSSADQRSQRFVAGVVCSATVAGGIPLVAAWNSSDARDIRGRPGSFWLSGESKDQIVLASVGGDLASLALPVNHPGSAFDVVDTGELVLLQDRTTGTLTSIDGVAGTVLDTELPLCGT